MKLEKIIGKVSNLIALFILYLICSITYMSAKGFIYKDGQIFLAKAAYAQEDTAFATPLKQRAVINLSKPHYLGSPDAPVTIYEYSSFGCTHCADFHLNTLKKLNKDYIEKGKVKVALVYFPIDKKSMKAALVASCIPDEYYHDFVNTLFDKQREWGLSTKFDEIIAGYAAHHGISKQTAFECMKNEKIISELMGNRQQGITEFNIQGTPTFLVDDGKTQELIFGAPSFSELSEYLDEKLAEK